LGSQANSGYVDDFVVDVVPAVVVDQHGHCLVPHTGRVVLLVDLKDGPLAPDGLSILNVHHLSPLHLVIHQRPLSPPFLELPLPQRVSQALRLLRS
jgi:hypothetical protein